MLQLELELRALDQEDRDVAAVSSTGLHLRLGERQGLVHQIESGLAISPCASDEPPPEGHGREPDMIGRKHSPQPRFQLRERRFGAIDLGQVEADSHACEQREEETPLVAKGNRPGVGAFHILHRLFRAPQVPELEGVVREEGR